jgi:hypothetical protein
MTRDFAALPGTPDGRFEDGYIRRLTREILFALFPGPDN